MKLKEFLEQYSDVEITQEQEEQIKKYLGVKFKRWVPEHGDKYFFIRSYNTILQTIFVKNDEVDAYRLFTNNCFPTEKEAEFRLEQIKVYYELKNFADENNDEIDWNDSEGKYYIGMDKTDSFIHINKAIFLQNIGQIYFSSEKLAYQAIKKVGADRIKKYLFGVE